LPPLRQESVDRRGGPVSEQMLGKGLSPIEDLVDRPDSNFTTSEFNDDVSTLIQTNGFAELGG
jgi:hypothetical protein